MAKPNTQNRKTKKQNRKPKTQNRKTKKQNRKTTKKQKGGTDMNLELVFAARDNNLDKVKETLDNGADINAKNNADGGKTALMNASEFGYIDIVKLLLEKGADVNVKRSDGSSALFYAAEFGYPDIAKLLLEKGADMNARRYEYTVLEIARVNENTEVVKVLEDHIRQQNVDADELTMIIRDESLDALKEYVEQGGDVNKKGSKGITALMEAIAIQDKSKAQYLIEQGADVNATSDDGKTAYSIAFGNDELVDLLKNAGANTNPTYLLLLAIEHNNTQSAKAMIDNRETLGLNINEQVPQYKTIQQEEPIYEYPLTLAIKKDNLEIVKHLLEAGASLDIESDQTYDADTQITDNQETPIILAVKEQNDMMVDLLLEENLKRDIYNRFDINRTSDSNYTALYKAVEKGYSLITDQLLKAGANPNHHNGPNETTPIIKAAQNRDLDMVEILFDAGADPLLEDATGTDALYTAYNNNDIHIIDYFTAKDVEGASTLMSELEQDQFFNSSNQEEDDQEDDEAFPPPPPAQKTDMKTVVQQIQQAPITIPPFYDVVNMTDTDMKTYLDEDPDNIIFIYNQQIVGSDKARIQHEITTNRTKVMLECKDPNTYFHQPKENIVKDEQDNLLYYLNMDIIGLAGIFLPIAQLKTLTESSQSRTFFVSTLEDKQHKDGGHVVTSFSSYDGDSVVSGKHCAENEAIKFGKLHAI